MDVSKVCASFRRMVRCETSRLELSPPPLADVKECSQACRKKNEVWECTRCTQDSRWGSLNSRFAREGHRMEEYVVTCSLYNIN